jgi:tRNA(Ile)-lysidine synthase
MALLHLLYETRAAHRLELVVAHADHGIHPDSADIAERVLRAATVLGLPAFLGRLGLGAAASETRARIARHAWLEQTRRTEGADAIAFAHHQDDQVETILLRMLGGSGPAGLAGMSPRQGRRLRPLLGFRKAELVAWLELRGIAGWVDPANSDPVHDRSWVRSVVLPLLAEREPSVGERLLRVGRQAAADRRAWDVMLDTLPGLEAKGSRDRFSIAALPLATYDSALATALLQAAARRIGCVLGGRRAERLVGMTRRGRSGAVMELGGDWRAELAFGRVCFYRVLPAPAPIPLRGVRGDVRWGSWSVSWTRAPTPTPARRDGWVGWFIGEGAVVRGPEAGDRLTPVGGLGDRAVARLLQEARVERSRRPGWPLVEVDGSIVWLVGICRGGGAVPRAGEDALRIEVSGG